VAVMDMKPLSLGELLDRTFTVYRNHFWTFVGIMALPEVIVVIASIGIQQVLRPVVLAPSGTATPAQTMAQFQQLMGTFFLTFGILFLVTYVLYTIALGATTFAVSDVYLGRFATIATSYSKVTPRIGALLGLNLVIFLALFACYLGTAIFVGIVAVASAVVSPVLGVVGAIIGFALGIAAIIWLFLGFSVSAPALLLEHSGVFQALKRSLELVRRNRGRVFVVLFLMTMMTYIVIIVFQIPFFIISAMMAAKSQAVPLWLSGISSIVGGVGAALSTPLLMVALALFYYDVRVRKEAFDLQVMVANLDVQPVGIAPGGAPPPPLG
jgi:glycerophosphoryl diester phosphodiesterase family protein